ncbi:transporter substrate-binding domain-containing protein [Pelobium manganitolerans]|uniref:transporter substrate-binding domain-containing protein n=1 Tax=Pelobium manganitolerans TaxID=1842495 RepID=UPI000E748FB3|nr:transporter substrate-binding domain-containing protein [Pelobium manganitolerans]
MKHFAFLFIQIFLFSAVTAYAQEKQLKVALAGGQPFVIQGKNPQGIAVEVWDQVAVKNRWDYKFIAYPSVHAALSALDSNQVDLVVGPVSITSERVLHMRFSQPYYQSSLAIVSRFDKPNIWEKIRPFFSINLLIAVAIFVFILSLVGTLLWIAEREASPEQFSHKPLEGIGTGMWLAIVTMSTTGYGDKAPITLWGRIIAGSWMVVSIIFATSMVAGIASTLTLSGMGDHTIKNIEQLNGKKAATLSASPSVDFLNEHGVKSVELESLADCFKKLSEGEVDAVVYDRPQLLYYLKSNQSKKLYIAKAAYYKQGYGFAFPRNTTLAHQTNITLLELSENDEIDRTVRHWIGTEE